MGFRGVENGAEGMGNEKKGMTTNDKEAGKTECFLGVSGPFRSLPKQRITRPGLEPGTTEPKSVVLPLHHRVTYTYTFTFTKDLRCRLRARQGKAVIQP